MNIMTKIAKMTEFDKNKIDGEVAEKVDSETRIKELEIMNRLLVEKVKKLSATKFDDLRAFGNENMGYISDRTLSKLIQYPTTSMIELIKLIHFDEKYPENHNIMIDDFDDNIVHIFDGEKWNPESFDDKMELLLKNKIEIIKKIYEAELQYGDLDDETKEKYERFMKRYESRDKCLMEYFSSSLRDVLERQKTKLSKIRKLPYL